MLGFSFLLLAAAFAVITFRADPVGPFPPETASGLMVGAAMALVASRRIVESFRASLGTGLNSLALWAVACAGIGAIYVNRERIEEGAVRLGAELAAGRPVASDGREVVVLRRFDGTFHVQGRVNGRETRFIFDTGASAVVLTSDTAKALGLQPAEEEFRVPISTANGRGFAAPVTLGSLAVGEIGEARVRAYVARPGTLSDNLLGMTFLDRLGSYEVRGNRLFLRGKAKPS